MAEEIFAIGFLENLKVLFVAVLIYALVFALLKKVKLFEGSDKINSLIALLSAIIVSFTGVVTYSISYAINWFIIIFFIVFLGMLLLLFLGVSFDDIASASKGKAKFILIAFGVLFLIIFLKSFFALNNTFDTSDPMNDSYAVDPSFNTGVNDITGVELQDGWYYTPFGYIDKDLVSAVLFLLVIGAFVFLIGRG